MLDCLVEEGGVSVSVSDFEEEKTGTGTTVLSSDQVDLWEACSWTMMVVLVVCVLCLMDESEVEMLWNERGRESISTRGQLEMIYSVESRGGTRPMTTTKKKQDKEGGAARGERPQIRREDGQLTCFSSSKETVEHLSGRHASYFSQSGPCWALRIAEGLPLGSGAKQEKQHACGFTCYYASSSASSSVSSVLWGREGGDSMAPSDTSSCLASGKARQCMDGWDVKGREGKGRGRYEKANGTALLHYRKVFSRSIRCPWARG